MVMSSYTLIIYTMHFIFARKGTKKRVKNDAFGLQNSQNVSEFTKSEPFVSHLLHQKNFFL